jgi:hypothetical protein
MSDVSERYFEPASDGGDTAAPPDPPVATVRGINAAERAPADNWQPGRRLIARRVADVPAEQVSWLWPGWLPLGKLAILDGDPGQGKSTVSLELAARVSAGRGMPDGTPVDSPAGVVILSAEDGVGDTIRPRLEAAGADLDRIYAVEAAVAPGGEETLPTLPLDAADVGRLVAEVEARLVIVDPLMAYLDGRTNSHRDHDIRRALVPLAQVAQVYGCTVLVIRHLNKAQGGRAVHRGGGSIGIIGAARVGLLAGQHPADENLRVLAVAKSNLAKTPTSLAYTLIEDTEHGCARVQWLGPTDVHADDLVAAHDPEERSALEEACDFLRVELANGPRSASEIQEAARRTGIAERTLKRAKAKLGVVSDKAEGVLGGQWFWRLPAEGGQEGQPTEGTELGPLGPLPGLEPHEEAA